MKKRCNNKGHWAFQRYGGRGIKVSSEWREFNPFYEWAMTNGYSDTLTLERKDNDGDYCPENCRWATRKEQANNKSNTILCDFMGERYTLSQLSDIYSIPWKTLYRRIRVNKWEVEKTVTTPVRRHKEYAHRTS